MARKCVREFIVLEFSVFQFLCVFFLIGMLRYYKARYLPLVVGYQQA